MTDSETLTAIAFAMVENELQTAAAAVDAAVAGGFGDGSDVADAANADFDAARSAYNDANDYGIYADHVLEAVGL